MIRSSKLFFCSSLVRCKAIFRRPSNATRNPAWRIESETLPYWTFQCFSFFRGEYPWWQFVHLKKNNSLIGSFFFVRVFLFFCCSLLWHSAEEFFSFQQIEKNCSLLLLFLLSESLSEILDSNEVRSSLALETSDWLSERLSASAAIVFLFLFFSITECVITTTPKTTRLLVDMSGVLHTSCQVNLVPKIAQAVSWNQSGRCRLREWAKFRRMNEDLRTMCLPTL